MQENDKFCDIHNRNNILYNKVENEKNNITIFDDNQIRDEKNISNLIDNKQTKTKKNISNSAKIKYIIIFLIYIILLLSIIIFISNLSIIKLEMKKILVI